MQAAITACDRGHKVTLIEKNDKLGGTLLFADYGHKDDLKNLKDYYVRQVEKRDIAVCCNTEATLELLDEINPSDLIVAAGASPRVPNLPGIENARYATAGYYEADSVGKKVVLIGGGLINCELAVKFLEEGKEVTILELTDGILRDANMFIKPTIQQIFEKYADSVQVIKNASTKSIEADGVIYTDTEGKEQKVSADTVLYAVGSIANAEVAEKLRAWPNWESFRAIGDCTGASIVKKAIHQGYFAAMDIL